MVSTKKHHLYNMVYMRKQKISPKTQNKDSDEDKNKMRKTKLMFLVLLTVLLVAACCQVGYSADTELTVDDLPGVGESLVINSNSILTINDGETAVIEGSLSVEGTNDTTIRLQIINNGEFAIKDTTVHCNHANFSIQNMGTTTFETAHFTVIGNSTIKVENENNWIMTETSVDVLGGYAYFTNNGSLNVENGYFKDQYDGTFFSNYQDADLSKCTFVSNGAKGKIELFNKGDLKISGNTFDVNYGGRININTLLGTLEATQCSVDVGGASHGTQSELNILGDDATWELCSFVNNGGKINYLNTGEVSITNCSMQIYSVNSSTIMTTSGPIVMEDCVVSGSGDTSITNWDVLTLRECSFDSSKDLKLMNNGEVKAENWLLKTLSDNAYITVYNAGNMTFNVPFIENVNSSALQSVGDAGQEFVESSGGIIKVTNKGMITEQTIKINDDSDSILIYTLVGVVAVAVIIVVFLFNRKNKQDEEE